MRLHNGTGRVRSALRKELIKRHLKDLERENDDLTVAEALLKKAKEAEQIREQFGLDHRGKIQILKDDPNSN